MTWYFSTHILTLWPFLGLSACPTSQTCSLRQCTCLPQCALIGSNCWLHLSPRWPMSLSQNDTQMLGQLFASLYTVPHHRTRCIHAPLSLLDDHMKVTWCATCHTQRSGLKELWQPHKASIVSFILLKVLLVFDLILWLFHCTLFSFYEPVHMPWHSWFVHQLHVLCAPNALASLI